VEEEEGDDMCLIELLVNYAMKAHMKMEVRLQYLR
jgi:hypothetical protein